VAAAAMRAKRGRLWALPARLALTLIAEHGHVGDQARMAA
jgi:hypothetical protein